MDTSILTKAIPALKTRSRTLVEMAQGAAFFFKDAIEMDASAQTKFLTPEIRPLLVELVKRLEAVSVFTALEMEVIFKNVMDEKGITLSKLAQPVRIALTGRTVSPGIYEVMEILGKDRSLQRLKKAIDLIPTDVAK